MSSRELHPILHGVAVLGIRALLLPSALVPLVLLLAYLLGRAGFSEAALLDWLWGTGPSAHPAWILYAVCAPVVALPFWLLAPALLVRVTGAAPLGTMSRWSVAYLRIWLRIGTVEAAGIWLSGTLFWPLWLRLAGMRIGKKCEISTILDVLPEHTEIGAESFLADGIYLGVPWIQRGTVTVGRTVLGAGTFLGNHVVIRSGERMARGMLLGICTVFDQARMGEGTAWFGHPAFLLPRREVVTLDRSLTHDPSPIRFGNRLFWESLRVLLPALPVWLALLWFDVVDRAEATHGLAMLALAVPLATLGVGIALTGVVLVLKWLLLGRVRPGQHALWSCWASRWDFHYVVWNLYGRGLLAALEGTLFLPWFLRAMGMRIGRGVVLGEGFAQVVDPDMLTLEDGATVHALFQAHSFEDRVLKIDRVRVGKGATVGRGTVLLYGADIGEQAHVAPHGVVMKREVLQPFRSYSGAPTAEVERAFETGAEPVREAIPTPAPAPRDEALDFARGLAVLGMVFLHFVPDTAGETGLGALCTGIVTALHGKPAALFAMLAGMSFVLQAGRRTDARRRRLWFARRALALGVAGLLLWIFVWPTEVLLPLALMMPLVVAIARGGPLRTLATILALLIAVPFATAAFWHYVEVDCLEDGTHLANSTFGWSTLRYFLFDGSYPILPWLVLLLLGALLVAGGHRQPNRSGRWFWVALPFALVMQTFVLWAEAAREELGALWPYLGPTWQPTSLVWLASIGSWAIVVIAGACWWQARRGLPAFVSRVTSVGRASLSHYLLHILLVFVPLRWWWPAEDWGVGVGLGAAAGYAVLALVVTPWWFSRFARGPFESALARASGS